MSTHYIPTLNYYDPAGRSIPAELRVQTDHLTAEALTSVGTYDYQEGEELGSVEMDRYQVTQLRDALTAVLEGN